MRLIRIAFVVSDDLPQITEIIKQARKDLNVRLSESGVQLHLIEFQTSSDKHGYLSNQDWEEVLESSDILLAFVWLNNYVHVTESLDYLSQPDRMDETKIILCRCVRSPNRLDEIDTVSLQSVERMCNKAAGLGEYREFEFDDLVPELLRKSIEKYLFETQIRSDPVLSVYVENSDDKSSDKRFGLKLPHKFIMSIPLWIDVTLRISGHRKINQVQNEMGGAVSGRENSLEAENIRVLMTCGGADIQPVSCDFRIETETDSCATFEIIPEHAGEFKLCLVLLKRNESVFKSCFPVNIEQF